MFRMMGIPQTKTGFIGAGVFTIFVGGLSLYAWNFENQKMHQVKLNKIEKEASRELEKTEFLSKIQKENEIRKVLNKNQENGYVDKLNCSICCFLVIWERYLTILKSWI